MSTFQEIQTQVKDKRDRMTVLSHLVEHLDETFRPLAGSDAKMRLLNDERLPISQETFDSIINDVLLYEIQALGQELNFLLSSQMTQTSVITPPPPPTAVETVQKAQTNKHHKS